MKQKIASSMFAVFLLGATVLPIVSANSSAFTFDLTYRVVDGEANGKSHGLDGGTMTVSGSMTPYARGSVYNNTINTITVAVYKKTLIGSSSVGSVGTNVTASLHSTTSFSKNLGSVSTGTFYMYISRLEDDGWDVSGSGSLVTK